MAASTFLLHLLRRVLLVALALCALAGAASADSWPERTEFWRQARDGAEGVSSQPGDAVLIQRHGTDWRVLRTGLVSTYGEQLVLVSLVVIAAVPLVSTRMRRFALGLAGRVRGLGALHRWAQAITGVSFLALGGTGLMILYGRRFIAPLVGKEMFAQLAQVSKVVHDHVSWLFMLGIVLLILMWVRDHLPGFPRKSPSRNLIFWSVIGGGIFVSYSGLALLFPLVFADLQQMQLMQIMHSLSSLTLASLIFAHMFIATMSIRENARKLGEAKEVLERRVEERTRELRELNEALRHANHGKDRFLAAVSHDLLQPMSAARLMVTALGGADLPEDARELAHRIHLALRGAEDLLTDFLDLSRLDATVMTPHRAPVPVAVLLDTLANEFRPMAAKTGLGLTVVKCGLSVDTDPHLLLRVLRNLASNAIRYTPEGRILVGCRRRGGALRFEVWDTGIGIAADRLRQIFAEFHREGEASSLHRRAWGLGLAIVDRIARVLNHPVTVRSTPGAGSVFAIEVPLAAPGATARPDFESDRGLEGVAVMAVENDEDILVGLTALLAGWGCRVSAHRSAAAAAAAVETGAFPPRLLIVDHHLDDGLGPDLVARLRGVLGDVPAVVITADHRPEVAARVAAMGLDLLRKPVRPAKLRALIEA
ncbi:MAG: response regulator, partial [Alphaproteobacteria bacterium]|nr:response regulator [Alphaproteobacteria bacterium]